MSAVQHRIDEVPLGATSGTGRLFVTNFSAVGPDPAAALGRVGASVMACMLTPHEIELRYPDYAHWLNAHAALRPKSTTAPPDVEPTAASPRALWLPTPDGGVVADAPVLELVTSVVAELDASHSVLVHCGAGMARTAVVSILAMTAFGADPDTVAIDFRKARPGGGPDGPPQQQQIARLAPTTSRLRASS